MAAPTVGNQSAAGGNNSAPTLTKPADATTGEMCYALINHRSTVTINSVPANWTEIATVAGASCVLHVYRHVYLAGDGASFAWGTSGSERWTANIFSVFGADTGGTNGADSVDIFDSNGTLTTPSVVTTGADRLILHFHGVWHPAFGATATLSTPGSTTLITRNQQTNNAAQSVYETQAVAGATTGRTSTTNTSSGKASIVVAIKPPAGGASLTHEVDDTATSSEARISGIGKATSDTTVSSETNSKTVGKATTDSVTASDQISNEPGLNPSDSATASDASALTVGKGLSDSITATDSFDRLVDFLRTFDDSAVANDAISNALSKITTDTVAALPNNWALNFDGVDDYVTIADSASSRPETGNKFSVYFEIYLTSYDNNVLPRIWEKRSIYMAIMGNSANLRYRQLAIEVQNASGTGNANGGASEFWGNTKLDLYRRYRVVATFDGDAASNQGKIYIDGNAESMTTIFAWSDVLQSTVGNDLYLARRRTDLTRNLAGTLDNFVMWQGQVLTAGEIDDVFNGSLPSGYEIYLSMNEGTGSTTADISGNANTGTITGANWTASPNEPDPTKAVGKATSDSATTSDANTKSVTLGKNDNVTPSEELLKAIGLARSDSVTATDDIEAVLILILELSDTTTVSEALAKAVGAAKADTVTASDLIARSMDVVFDDSAATLDATQKSIGVNKTDIAASSESIAKLIGLFKSDEIFANDVLVKVMAFALSLADSVEAVDAISVLSSGIATQHITVIVDSNNNHITIRSEDTALTLSSRNRFTVRGKTDQHTVSGKGMTGIIRSRVIE